MSHKLHEKWYQEYGVHLYFTHVYFVHEALTEVKMLLLPLSEKLRWKNLNIEL